MVESVLLFDFFVVRLIVAVIDFSFALVTDNNNSFCIQKAVSLYSFFSKFSKILN